MAIRLAEMTWSVVVVSYRPGDWLTRCLESVVREADEVVLVDNGSVDEAASTIGHATGVKVIRSADNLGFAGGVNLGIAHTRGDTIALLNDDARALPGWLESAGKALAAPDTAAVVPRVLRSGWYREVVLDEESDAPADHRELGRKLHSVMSSGREVLSELLGAGIYELETAGEAPATWWRWTRPRTPFYVPVEGPEETEVLLDAEPAPDGVVCRLINKAGGYLHPDGVLGDRGDETPDDSRWDKPGETFFASGTAMAARRETFERLGALAEPYFAYYEDVDWSWRARLAGMAIVYDPASVVEHRHSATSGGSTPTVRRMATRNRALTLARNAPWTVALRGARRAWRDLPGPSSRGDLARKLAWAFGSRRSLGRLWAASPQEVWDAWAGVGAEWDRGPASVPKA